MPSCRHGTFNHSQGPLENRALMAKGKATEHDKKCSAGGGTFGHPGAFGTTIVCCTGCGKKVN